MMLFVTKTGLLLLTLLLLFTPLLIAHSESERPDHGEESQGVEFGVISGLTTFVLAVSTVVVGRLMKKGKASIKTHHALAYITVVLALFHGIYNFLAH
ncbi:MAG: hypothetical protein GTO24_20115 [candidate division Zixibacteria bacterium]|nr:hypothetical protein [candidate division Zixibacteria bacterium]